MCFYSESHLEVQEKTTESSKSTRYINIQYIYILYSTYIRFSECQLSVLVILFRRPVGPMAGGDLSDAKLEASVKIYIYMVLYEKPLVVLTHMLEILFFLLLGGGGVGGDGKLLYFCGPCYEVFAVIIYKNTYPISISFILVGIAALR